VQKSVEHAVPAADGVYVHAPAVHAAVPSHVGIVAEQFTHAAPLSPHAVTEPLTVQTFPAPQHPLHAPSAHEPPATHVCVVVLHTEPAAQSVAALQPHAPATHAVPATLPAHGPHIAPPDPHCVALSDVSPTHVVPLQQPAHIVPLHAHAPATHDCPMPQIEQAPPPAPHAPGALPIWHMPVASQHPVGHVVALHEPHV
jgi:hypothetical protein